MNYSPYETPFPCQNIYLLIYLLVNISRTHAAFLAIISIFTGMIAPTVGVGSLQISYLMSNMGWIAFGILLLLIIGFYSAAIKSWGFFRGSMTLVMVGLIVLFLLSVFGQIIDNKTGTIASGVKWGWIFLFVWSLLAVSAYHHQNEEERGFSDSIDTVIGILGSLALICLTGLIFMNSYSGLLPGFKKQNISTLMGEQSMQTLSGDVEISIPYTRLSQVSFDRKKDILSMLIGSGESQSFISLSKRNSYAREVEEGLSPVIIWESFYKTNNDGDVFSGTEILTDAKLIGKEDPAMFVFDGNTGRILSSHSTWEFSHTGTIENPILSKNRSTLVWEAKNADGTMSVYRQGVKIWGNHSHISDVHVSSTGEDVMFLSANEDGTQIIKNGESIGILPKNMIEDSYISDGSKYAYQMEQDGIIKLMINGEVLERTFEEVREVFLEDDGYSYAYFARPVGEPTYCFFTRYKGNICGITAYMNPKLGADGTSLLFAGKKDGNWGIYRNVERLVKDTGYTSEDIRYDYVFLDTTNPRSFVFIKKNADTGKYQFIKNGVLLPQSWDDVGLDVSFGFDNQIITSVQDDTGWHIIEL